MPRKNTKKEKIDGTLKKPKEKKFSWKEHNKWLDSFRGTIVYRKDKEGAR